MGFGQQQTVLPFVVHACTSELRRKRDSGFAKVMDYGLWSWLGWLQALSVLCVARAVMSLGGFW